MTATRVIYEGEWYDVDSSLAEESIINSFKAYFPELGPSPFYMKTYAGDEIHYFLAKTPLSKEKKGNLDFFSTPNYMMTPNNVKSSWHEKYSPFASIHSNASAIIQSDRIKSGSITSLDASRTHVKDMRIEDLKRSIIKQFSESKDTHPFIVLGEYADKGGYAAYVGKEASIVATNDELGVHTVRMKEDESEWVIRQKDIKEKGV